MKLSREKDLPLVIGAAKGQETCVQIPSPATSFRHMISIVIDPGLWAVAAVAADERS